MRALAALVFLCLSAWGAAWAVPAPNTLVLVACRVDDMGLQGRDPSSVAQGWRNLELHIDNGTYECKRVVIANIVDKEAAQNPSIPELKPNFGNPATCGMIGMSISTQWEQKNPQWAVVAVGCPSPAIDKSTGKVVAWSIPSCPEHLPGTNNPMRCNYDDSEI